jgi:CDP-diacylglycerol--serine O-phosphatidyltransferase
MSNFETKPIHFLLPNLFTSLNMGCGFFSIVFALQGKYYLSCLAIGIGAIFDLFDGKVARWTGTQSAFGEQFDSLSDLVSFGVAPALIFYIKFLQNAGRIGIVISFIYLLCAALRLARFNVNISTFPSKYFQGLPSPGCALSIVGFILLSLETDVIVHPIASMIYLFFYSILMITTMPFLSLKDTSWVSKYPRKTFIGIVLLLASIVIYEEVIVFSLMNLYVLICFVYYAKNRKTLKSGFIDLDRNSEEPL